MDVVAVHGHSEMFVSVVVEINFTYFSAEKYVP